MVKVITESPKFKVILWFIFCNYKGVDLYANFILKKHCFLSIQFVKNEFLFLGYVLKC